MNVITAEQVHIPAWVALRGALWDDDDHEGLAQECQSILDSDREHALLLLDEAGSAVGFIEGALYFDGPKKYGYVEGWYVAPEVRGKGYGEMLMDELETWILHQSINLVLSDTIPETYPLSTKAHLKNGYEEFMNIRVFRKQFPTN